MPERYMSQRKYDELAANNQIDYQTFYVITDKQLLIDKKLYLMKELMEVEKQLLEYEE